MHSFIASYIFKLPSRPGQTVSLCVPELVWLTLQAGDDTAAVGLQADIAEGLVAVHGAAISL